MLRKLVKAASLHAVTTVVCSTTNIHSEVLPRAARLCTH